MVKTSSVTKIRITGHAVYREASSIPISIYEVDRTFYPIDQICLDVASVTKGGIISSHTFIGSTELLLLHGLNVKQVIDVC